jgi:hypothetical protein
MEVVAWPVAVGGLDAVTVATPQAVVPAEKVVEATPLALVVAVVGLTEAPATPLTEKLTV